MSQDREPSSNDAVEWAKALIAAPLTEPRVVELLTLVRSIGDDRARMAAWALGFEEVPEGLRNDAVLSLLEMLADATCRGTVRGQTAEAVAELLEFSDHLDPVRGIAVALFIDMLNDLSPDVRFWCAFGLGRLRAIPAVPFLRELTIDTTLVPGWWTVGEEAADAIDWIEGRDPVGRVGRT